MYTSEKHILLARLASLHFLTICVLMKLLKITVYCMHYKYRLSVLYHMQSSKETHAQYTECICYIQPLPEPNTQDVEQTPVFGVEDLHFVRPFPL